ncbi:BrnA antitoxin family protein [Jiella avicenniae]|uniref:BrnA antitoxin family protein n=1 Tax=Jiella avicenniae TaxID=2907202 RepID=A0A9X1NVM0_9HYPH|nr:BrnA antitoxin family protein [Jiella avicenniae]MCE7026505.1 BrnA antitoxin family protein [Jiella avicenniae]
MTHRGKTDFELVDDDAELTRQEHDDVDLSGIPADWLSHAHLETGIPAPRSPVNKRPVTIRLDSEVVDYFKGQGRGWQTQINAILKAFVDRKQGGA